MNVCGNCIGDSATEFSYFIHAAFLYVKLLCYSLHSQKRISNVNYISTFIAIFFLVYTDDWTIKL